MRNPKWTRDELIFALNFYLKQRPNIPDKASKEVEELSHSIRSLGKLIFGDLGGTFRNKNGVYMKLMNFKSVDPLYSGKGLESVGKATKEVWNEFYGQEKELVKIAKNIRAHLKHSKTYLETDFSSDEEVGVEGTVLTRIHKSYERDNSLKRKKISAFKKQYGKVFCEICEFDFFEKYGERGSEYIECHHLKPVSELPPNYKTKINELLLVCSNCHRMIHRKKPWLSPEKLKSLVI